MPSRAEILRLKRRIAELEPCAVRQGDKSSYDTTSNDKSSEVTAPETRVVPGLNQEDDCDHVSQLVDAGRRTEAYSQSQDSRISTSPAATQRSARNPRPADHDKYASRMERPLPDNNDSYFGGSSTLFFLGQMRTAVQQKLGITDPAVLSNREELIRVVHGNASKRQKPSDYVLPGRRKADKLLSVYWDMVHPLYPLLDKGKFLGQYEDLWVTQESDADEPVFLGTLNIMFALSSHFNEEIHPEERQTQADEFFERAKESMDLWQMNTLQSVQMLLLASLFLQSTCAINQCWMITGVAIRTAQSLGLHLCETSRRIVSRRDRELARKVWHTCVLLDQVVAMTYGRPSMIRGRLDTQVPLPLCIDEDLLSANEHQPIPTPSQPSVVDFFVQSVQLFEILDEVLEGFYSYCPEQKLSIEEVLEKSLGRTATANKWSILDLDRRLLNWNRDLPDHLRFDQSRDLDESRIFTRLVLNLRQRYLHTRLLALRPILCACVSSEKCSLDGETSNLLSLSERIAVQCSVACVSTAQEMIALGYYRLPSDPASVGLIAAWWYNVLFIYSAALVLVAVRLRPSIFSEIPEDAILRSWNDAIEVLKAYQTFNPVIQRCVAALELISCGIPDRVSQSRHQPQQYESNGAQEALFQDRINRQMLLAQGFTSIAPLGEQLTTGLVDRSEENILDDYLFSANDLSWLSVVPFEL